MGDASQSFKERNSTGINQGEQLFEAYCQRVGAFFYRFGFDEKLNQIPKFYHLNPILRHLPDYIVHNPKTGKTMAVEVKGSLNYKTSDFDRLADYKEAYGTQQAPYLIVFALPERIIWATPTDVADAYEWSTTLGQWSDGVKYRTLTLG